MSVQMSEVLSINGTDELIRFIKDIAVNTIFSCEFVKRTTGENRVMLCRLGVRKGVVGQKPLYDALERGLLPVYDMQKKDYRMISMDGLLWIKIRGTRYEIKKGGEV